MGAVVTARTRRRRSVDRVLLPGHPAHRSAARRPSGRRRDLRSGRRRSTDFAARAQAGIVKINRPTAGLDLNVPFGGVKDSSINTFREQGRTALDFYTWGKTVYTGI